MLSISGSIQGPLIKLFIEVPQLVWGGIFKVKCRNILLVARVTFTLCHKMSQIRIVSSSFVSSNVTFLMFLYNAS